MNFITGRLLVNSGVKGDTKQSKMKKKTWASSVADTFSPTKRKEYCKGLVKKFEFARQF